MCEPIFDRPLKEISFGRVLLRLFQTARRFNLEVQPQLVMLQKTLLNIEGLGRDLDPDLDLWTTAKPYLERWMQEQIGWRGLVRTIPHEAPTWANLLPQLPRLVHRALAKDRLKRIEDRLDALVRRGAAAHADGAAGRLAARGVRHGRILPPPARLTARRPFGPGRFRRAMSEVRRTG